MIDQLISEALEDFNKRLKPMMNAVGLHYLVFLYPYPTDLVSNLSTEARLQIEKRCTQALQKTFHQELEEVRKNEQLARP
jgi:hypothetical protein